MIQEKDDEKGLKQPEEVRDLLQETFNSMTDAVFILDARLPVPTIVECNQAASTIFGYDKAEMLGRTTGFLHASEEALREFQSQLYRAVQQQRQRFHLHEFRMKRKDGSIFPSEHSISQLLNDKGERTGWVSIVRDITERKQAEEKLRQSVERYHSLFDRMLDGIYRSTHEGRFVEVNPAFVKMFRYSSKQEMMDIKNIAKELYFSPEERGSHILDTGQDEVEAYRMRRKDGSEIWVEDHGHYVHDEEGNIIYHEGIMRDITERKRAEEALRESETKYRSLVEQSLQGIMIAQGPVPQIVFANPTMTKILGYTPDELTSLSPKETEGLVHPQDRAAFFSRLSDRLQGKPAPQHYEFRGIRKDGGLRWLESSASKIEYQGQPAVQATYVDITDRKRMEDELRRLSQFRESVIDNAHVWIDVLDEKENVVVWNKAAEAISGYSREEVIGHDKIWEWLYPDEKYRRYLTGLVADVVQHGRVEEDFETTIRRKDGQIRIISWNERGLMDEYGKAIGSIALGRDVTEHKKMEDELRESQAEYKSLFEDSPMPLSLQDQSEVKKSLDRLKNSGITDFAAYFQSHPEVVRDLVKKVKILDVNQATSKLYEAPNREAYQEGLTRLFTEESFDSFRKQLAKMAEGSTQFQNEYTTLTFSGDKKRISLTWSVAPGYEESFSRVFVSTIDITERKRMEDALRQYSTKLEQLVLERTKKLAQSEKKFRSLVENIPDVTWTTDQKGHTIFISPNVTRVYGYTPEEIYEAGDTVWLGRIHPDDLPHVQEAFDVLFTRNKAFDVEYRIQRKDGNWIWLHDRSVSAYEKGGMRYADGVFSDVTDRKRAEEELRAARERLEYAVASNPAVIYTGKPLADYSDFVLTYLSGTVITMLGFEPREFIGHPEFWDSHVHPEDRRTVLEKISLLWKKGQHAYEYRFLHKDGTYRWIREEGKIARDTDGKPIEVNGYWTDVSERKRLEEELVKSQRLAAIGETSAMVGHDLRNPLQGIVGVVYLAKKSLESRKAADRKAAAALLDIIEEQVVYMDKIVSDLQDYAQPLIPRITETNLPDLIRQTLSTIKIPRAIKASIGIEKAAEKVMIDPTLMRRTLTNLTTNAIQAMPERGKLTIRARSKGDSTIITVEDTGVGIPRKNLAKIFNPFFTTKAQGQGLGLAVCKRLVEAQGGTITAKSKPRKGTAFTIKLPRAKKEVAS